MAENLPIFVQIDFRVKMYELPFRKNLGTSPAAGSGKDYGIFKKQVKDLGCKCEFSIKNERFSFSR